MSCPFAAVTGCAAGVQAGECKSQTSRLAENKAPDIQKRRQHKGGTVPLPHFPRPSHTMRAQSSQLPALFPTPAGSTRLRARYESCTFFFPGCDPSNPIQYHGSGTPSRALHIGRRFDGRNSAEKAYKDEGARAQSVCTQPLLLSLVHCDYCVWRARCVRVARDAWVWRKRGCNLAVIFHLDRAWFCSHAAAHSTARGACARCRGRDWCPSSV